MPAAKNNPEELQALRDWLSSYSIHELFEKNGDVVDEIKSILPQNNLKKMGQLRDLYDKVEKISIPDWKQYAVAKGAQQSSMKTIGSLIDQIFVENPRLVRLFSPDELESNKLGESLAHTTRNFQWNQFSNAQGGRVIEVLSEHMCQGFLQGYTMTGRVGIFPSYESFLGIIHTMMVQYAKFNKMVSFSSSLLI